MTFNKCSINGRAYGDVIDLRTGDIIEITEVSQSIYAFMQNIWKQKVNSNNTNT